MGPLIKQGTSFFIAFGTKGGKGMGLIRYDNIKTQGSAWWTVVHCQALDSSKCYGEVVGYSSALSAFIMAGNVIDQTDQKTFLGHFMIKSDGTFVWNYLIEQAATVLTDYFRPVQMQVEVDNTWTVSQYSGVAN